MSEVFIEADCFRHSDHAQKLNEIAIHLFVS
jgi:hypothetical protein